MDRGTSASALSAIASVLVNFVPSRERVVPYAAAGGGVYRASFGLASARFLGPVGSLFGAEQVVCPAPGTGVGFGPGAGFGPGTGTCPANATGYWGVGQMPGFYARRMGPMVVPPGGVWEDRSFTDPAMSVGGGIRFNVTRHVMVRPDVRALIEFADSDTPTMAVARVNLGYRF